MTEIPDQKEIATEFESARENLFGLDGMLGTALFTGTEPDHLAVSSDITKDPVFREQILNEIKDTYYKKTEIHIRFLLNTLDKFKDRADNKKTKELKETKKVIDDLLLQSIKNWNEFLILMDRREKNESKKEIQKRSDLIMRSGEDMRKSVIMMGNLLDELQKVYSQLGYNI